MTKERIAELRDVCDRATLGPWVVDTEDDFEYWLMTGAKESVLAKADGLVEEDKQNFDFIAMARTALPELLDALEAANKEIENLRAQVHTHHEGCRIANCIVEARDKEIARLREVLTLIRDSGPDSCAPETRAQIALEGKL